MEPYSLITGHLLLMNKIRKQFPSDSHQTIINKKIMENWNEYFPGATECPPVIYLDLWPFVPFTFAMVVSPELCAQLTQVTPQPRQPMFKWAQKPLTDGLDMLSLDWTGHKLWRSRLNPGFSSQSLNSHFPALIEEVDIFSQIMTSQAGPAGEWGQMFTMYDKVIALTFDIIARITTGLRLYEQSSGPSPLLVSLRNLIACLKLDSLKNRIERHTPSFKRKVYQNAEVIRKLLQPEVEARILESSKLADRKTVVDLAVKEMGNEQSTRSEVFVEEVIANLKIFLFAGHETTAQTLCWVYWEINKYPGVVEKLRKEHDQVLGKDPTAAKKTLLSSHHKLSELSYTTAVIKETLRLRPPAGTLRKCAPDFAFVEDGVQYPTYDCVVQTTPVALHRHPDLWPTSNEFIPERFLGPENDPLRPVKNAFRPFELGTMRCIGEELAMMEMKLALVFTLRELDMEFNYDLWDKVQGRAGPVQMQDGERAYRAGKGMGTIKDELPTRVRLRTI
ncbi:hypothetical protein PFICI_03992 [Pestalotiopsis fici W106-1]|uniref:Cytochrome P450 n=1 Tax=Pestalotiopsis fici (strain W106-1 / CGMCC3.15140) TaxID=1229662 RepID=W3XKH4_PESFW|nr:uncharacterized protein PFICI_03992 [Pestalotiopsis fici W106-1]ETS85967.1 hypothetical protein PFICI_03992 [Pestalotiopsis fici W106-1]